MHASKTHFSVSRCIFMQARLQPTQRWAKYLWLPLIRAAQTKCAITIFCRVYRTSIRPLITHVCDKNKTPLCLRLSLCSGRGGGWPFSWWSKGVHSFLYHSPGPQKSHNITSLFPLDNEYSLAVKAVPWLFRRSIFMDGFLICQRILYWQTCGQNWQKMVVKIQNIPGRFSKWVIKNPIYYTFWKMTGNILNFDHHFLTILPACLSI